MCRDVELDFDGVAQELERLRSQLASEDEKFRSWKEENIRRRFNYVPFIMGMLKTLAARGHLVRLLEEGEQHPRSSDAVRC